MLYSDSGISYSIVKRQIVDILLHIILQLIIIKVNLSSNQGDFIW